ncbi:MAG: Gfo/Idh/MocA family oxidoreductase [Bryobacteraceae bacterium]|nr:Gfo/Idh/MocA family oxidoreductase [Bryobacteraceae bacterium]
MQQTPDTPTRRAVFRTAAAAIATAQFPILGANDRVNLGIVGLGGRGTDHMKLYSKLSTDARITGVCDVNQAARERASALVQKLGGSKPNDFADMRKLFESKDIDAVSVATPNHWHALSTIWACQAGKDVYVEKPASHNCYESMQMVKAARKYKRMVQVGSQSRTMPHKQKAVELIREGAIGTVYHARGECFRRRFPIGNTPDQAVPAGIDWSLFLGPAQMKPFSTNKFAYNWHWFWDTGNGDIGNQGIHEMDVALWGLGMDEGWPDTVMSTGGRYEWKDDAETPNTQLALFRFGDRQLTFDVRNLPTPPEGGGPVRNPNYVGNIFFGTKGWIVVDHSGMELWSSKAASISGEAARGAGAGNQEKYEKTFSMQGNGEPTEPHMKNFLDAVKSRDYTSLNAEIAKGAHSAAYCHIANIAYRTGHQLKMNKEGKFVGDAQANELWTRKYRAPYVIPENV